jgi:hypothetical protein
MDQFMGLNAWATKVLEGCGKPHFSGKHETRGVVLADGTEGAVEVPVLESCVRREPTGKKYLGMFDNEYEFLRHTFRDGRMLEEHVQASPWSSGPVFFLALKDEKGEWIKESLWSEEEIEAA